MRPTGRRLLVLVGAVAVLAAACSSNPSATPPKTQSPGAEQAIPRGGTLRLALTSDFSSAFDPQKEYYAISWEYFRCCLLRTLMSYNGEDTAQDGASVFPDLAASDPQVSSDGLTWTFKLKTGIHYAPPLQDVSVTSGDFVRALEREACSQCAAGGYPFYYSVIKGFDAYAGGKADSITGLQAPDDSTLVVTLDQPAGDLPYRFAMPATAPIPPNPARPSARLGVAEGHDRDYGRFMVASGPYMLQGADQIDFSAPAAAQKSAAGYVPGKQIVLVRNPSWNRSTDDLRLANVDEIDTQFSTASTQDLANQVDTWRIDLVQDSVPPTNQLQKYSTDPDLKDQLHIFPSDAVRYVSLNIAQPPFDDIHVRKALNYAIDKDALRELRGGPAFGEIAGHLIVDSLENNQLKSFDPYATPNSRGDLQKAKAEMRQSKYDSNGDGMCDADVCRDVLAVIDQADPYPQQTKLIAQNLRPLGITLDVKAFERTTANITKCNDPSQHIPMCPSQAWGKDYADAFTYGPPLFGSESIGPLACCNTNMVGASAQTLRKFHYPSGSVPSVDSLLRKCAAQTGDARVSCWADLDRQLMDNVVPWVPYLFDNNVDLTSSRVLHYSFDQFAGVMALDQVAIQPGS